MACPARIREGLSLTQVRLGFRVFALGAALLLSASQARGVEENCSLEIHSNSQARWEKVSRGLEARDFHFRFRDGSFSRMASVRIDPDHFDIRLWWQTSKNYFSSLARQVAEQTKAAVVVNASYFDENGRPMGYFRSGDMVYNSRLLYRGRRRALHLGAVFYVREKSGKVGIATREEFDAKGVREAFQAGPYLVHGGKPDPGLEAYREFRRPDRRTILALGKDGRLSFLVSEEIGRGISWCELQYFLTRPESEGGLDAAEAMNLDGGSSSQLYVRGGDPSRQIQGRNVPALIVVVPRQGKGGS